MVGEEGRGSEMREPCERPPGGDRATIRETIFNSRRGVMPGWNARLSPETIKQLAVFVHSLGGGK